MQVNHESAPKLSVVVITYNQRNYIETALKSILSQNVNFITEVIVADDASTDGTQEIISEYAARNDDIVPILRKKNVGAGANFKDAIRHAKGEYIALCEGDDYWTDTHKLQKQVNYMEANPNSYLCFHPVKVVYQDDSHETSLYPDKAPRNGFILDELIKQNFIQTNSVMYRRISYEDMPMDILPLDWYMHITHARMGDIGYIDEPMGVYRKHSEGIWWGSQDNADGFWQRHGVAHVGLYVELKKILQENPKHIQILNDDLVGLYTAFNKINNAQARQQLLRDTVKKYPESVLPYLENYRIEKDRLLKHADRQAEIIQHLEREVEHHKGQEAGLTARIEELENQYGYKVETAVRRTFKRTPKQK